MSPWEDQVHTFLVLESYQESDKVLIVLVVESDQRLNFLVVEYICFGIEV
jgi:hypothetical protein